MAPFSSRTGRVAIASMMDSCELMPAARMRLVPPCLTRCLRRRFWQCLLPQG
jgi:hypothetical protein